MANQTTIANIALGKFGQSRITDINQASPAAQKIRDVWDSARRAALRGHHWNFAIKQAELTEDADTPLFKWAKQFPLPSDYIRLVSCNCVPSGTKITYFDVQAGMLLTNWSTAKIEYVRDETNCALWDDQFVDAFACKLGALVAPALMADGGQAAALLMQNEFVALMKAMSSDNIEQKPLVVNALRGSAYQAARCLPAPGEGSDGCLEPGIWGIPAEYDVQFNPWAVPAP